MTFAVIVQARMGSSRLPGKMFQFLGVKTALERCLDRCAEIPGVDEVVCTVPRTVADDPIAEIARRGGYRVSRGDEHDVLARYAKAAEEVAANVVMRVTADCPFIDPEICGRVRDLWVAAEADYACNNMPAKFPHGLDCEVFAAERLYDADWLAHTVHEREHVTPWLRTREDYLKVCLTGPGAGLEHMRWTLDYPEDLMFFRAVYDELGEAAATAPWTEIASLCLRRPDLARINQTRTDQGRFKPGVRATLQTTPTPFALAA
ncbi:MAG: glycosyltransferase family protein [Maricaulaceae bacterium]